MKKLMLPLATLVVLAVCICFPMIFSLDNSAARQETLLPSSTAPLSTPLSGGAPESSFSLQDTPSSQPLQLASRKQEALPHVNLFSAQNLALSFSEKITLLRSLFPHGAYWNHPESASSALPQDYVCTTVSQTPCYHAEVETNFCNEYDGEFLYGYDINIQCLGFSSMLSDFLFGKQATLTEFYETESLQPGDHIRLEEYEHSMIVVAVGTDSVQVVECNRDYESCLIEWDRTVTFTELNDTDCVFYTRTAPYSSENSPLER